MSKNKYTINPNSKSFKFMSGIIFIFMAVTMFWPGITGYKPETAKAGEINTTPAYEELQKDGEAKKAEAELKLQQAEKLKELCSLDFDQPELCGDNNYDSLNQELEQLPATEEDQISKKDQGSVATPTQKATSSIESIQTYINKYFPTSPVTAQMIVDQSVKSGVPVGFILAVGHNESHMGTKGRAVQTRNPFNVGNTDAGDTKAVDCATSYNNCLVGWQAGLDAFTSLITRCYFNEGEPISLQTWVDRDFRAVRCNIAGKRYMTDVRASQKYVERINDLQQLNIDY